MNGGGALIYIVSVEIVRVPSYARNLSPFYTDKVEIRLLGLDLTVVFVFSLKSSKFCPVQQN